MLYFFKNCHVTILYLCLYPCKCFLDAYPLFGCHESSKEISDFTSLLLCLEEQASELGTISI